MNVTFLAITLAALTAGCRGAGMDSSGTADRTRESVQQARLDMADKQAKRQLMREIRANPDVPAWHEQREKMALALGDRQFDKSFDRVFDSMTVALAGLGCRVYNMERASGYIAATIPELPPAQLRALHEAGFVQYAVAKGYPADILDRKRDTHDDSYVNTSEMESRFMSGLTLSMVRQGPETTKVKVRFDKVYYPALVDEYYKVVWQAVDKQLFLDKGTD